MSDMIFIHNKLDQVLELALRGTDGALVAVRLPPRGKHGPVAVTACDTAQIANLAARGSIVLRSV